MNLQIDQSITGGIFESWLVEYDLHRIEQIIDAIEYEKNTDTVVDWSRKRIMPEGSPFPGEYQPEKTPYIIDIMHNLSPCSETEVVVVCKPAQAGATAGTAENLVGFIVDGHPGPTLYVTATEKLALEWSSKRLEPMLDLCNLTHRLRAPTKKKGNSSTGNSTLSKAFPGGQILVTSYSAIAMLRSMPFQYLIMDEIDASEDEVGQEGDPVEVAKKRTSTYSGRRKILMISTPLDAPSKIWNAYLEGDQNKFWVGCPHCFDPEENNMIHLSLLDDQMNFRLEYEYEDGTTDIVKHGSVHFICPLCGCEIRNEHKTMIYENGWYEWRPENEHPKRLRKSYWWDAVYNPVGMDDWETMAQEWISAQHDSGSMKTFINLRAARPHEEKEMSVTDEQVKANISGYSRGTVPDEVIFTIGGADLHGDRLDLEIVGFDGEGTYSIDWKHYFGKPSMDPGGSLNNFMLDFIGGKLPGNPKYVFIDKNYKPSEVYRLAGTCPGVFAVDGEEWIKGGELFREKIIKESNGIKHIRCNTGHYKGVIRESLAMEPVDSGQMPKGYIRFPRDYEDAYYSQLNSEVRVPVKDKATGRVIKWRWMEFHSKGNHALDCHVYALCGGDYYIYQIAKALGFEDDYEDAVWNLLKNKDKMDLILMSGKW